MTHTPAAERRNNLAPGRKSWEKWEIGASPAGTALVPRTRFKPCC